VYNTFPVFARWALKRKADTEPEAEAAPIETAEARASTAKSAPAEQSGIKPQKQAIPAFEIAERSGAD